VYRSDTYGTTKMRRVSKSMGCAFNEYAILNATGPNINDTSPRHVLSNRNYCRENPKNRALRPRISDQLRLTQQAGDESTLNVVDGKCIGPVHDRRHPSVGKDGQTNEPSRNNVNGFLFRTEATAVGGDIV